MNIFYIAGITGKAGVWAVKKNIAELKRRYQPDFIIANADMATGAGGLGKQHAGYLRKMGIDCITGGDCIFQKKDLVENLPQMPFVLRPCNLPEHGPGSGYRYFIARSGEKLAVISLLGRVGRHRLLADNPFTLMQALLPHIATETPFIVVDFSSIATAEKQTMAFFLAGKVSALIGSGTGAAAADERPTPVYPAPVRPVRIPVCSVQGRKQTLCSIAKRPPISRMRDAPAVLILSADMPRPAKYGNTVLAFLNTRRKHGSGSVCKGWILNWTGQAAPSRYNVSVSKCLLRWRLSRRSKYANSADCGGFYGKNR